MLKSVSGNFVIRQLQKPKFSIQHLEDMKFCSVCQTRYDEDILRFCPQDGTPLVEENPTFTELPSESEEADDIGEETLISRNRPSEIPPAQPNDDDEDFSEPGQRIIIPMTDEKDEPPPVRPKVVSETRYEQPQKSNTALVVLVTMMGTILVLGVLGGMWYFLSGRNSANTNSNQNVNVNINSAFPNSNIDTNFNVNNSLGNFNLNTNANENVNANLATPTRTPTPTPTKTPEDENTNTNANINLGNTNVMTRPSPSPAETASPTPRVSPSPSATATPPPSNVNVGIMNSRAVNLVKPAYPQSAKQMNASGQVTVQIAVDEDGNVLSAKAVSGNNLLRPSAEYAAKQSRFNPVKINDRPVRATGLIVYNFINQ